MVRTANDSWACWWATVSRSAWSLVTCKVTVLVWRAATGVPGEPPWSLAYHLY
jgi:hypothetical protein